MQIAFYFLKSKQTDYSVTLSVSIDQIEKEKEDKQNKPNNL